MSSFRSRTSAVRANSPIKSTRRRKTVHGGIVKGKEGTTKVSKTPMTEDLWVSGSRVTSSHSKIALQTGGGFVDMRSPSAWAGRTEPTGGLRVPPRRLGPLRAWRFAGRRATRQSKCTIGQHVDH